MKNPFLDFKHVALSPHGIPVERILEENRQLLDALLAGYRSLDQADVKEFCRLLSHGLKFNMYKTFLSSLEMPKFLSSTLTIALAVYESSLQFIGGIDYAPYDLEEIYRQVTLDRTVGLEQSAPLGLYLSAMMNASKEHRFDLHFDRYESRPHFLGFRLKAGKQLWVKGDAGHFTAAGLQGGSIKVHGSTGSWCGAAMTGGDIEITGDAHSKTGERMEGGRILVRGHIQEIAKYRSGGKIRGGHEKKPPLAEAGIIP